MRYGFLVCARCQFLASSRVSSSLNFVFCPNVIVIDGFNIYQSFPMCAFYGGFSEFLGSRVFFSEFLVAFCKGYIFLVIEMFAFTISYSMRRFSFIIIPGCGVWSILYCPVGLIPHQLWSFRGWWGGASFCGMSSSHVLAKAGWPCYDRGVGRNVEGFRHRR